MTEQMHPMVPSNTLLNNWESDWLNERENFDMLLIQAYQAGADAELEACCEWLQDPDLNVDTYELRAARRPKPPSLKQQALQELDKVYMLWYIEEFDQVSQKALETIRKALEALPDD